MVTSSSWHIYNISHVTSSLAIAEEKGERILLSGGLRCLMEDSVF